MKNLINKLISSISSTKGHLAFLTIDHSNITVSLYEKSKNQPITKLLMESTKEIKGVDKEHIFSPTLFAHSIAECIDSVEEKANLRIKHVVLSLIGFNSKHLVYPLIFKSGEKINVENLLTHVNPKEIKYYLGEDYFLTNLIPLSLTNNEEVINSLNINPHIQEDIKINFLVAGFKKIFICKLFEIFYNLSLNIENILFTGAVLPYVFKNNKDSILLIGTDYTLLHTCNNIIFLSQGTNSIFHNISKKTNIPYNVLQKNGYLIKDVLVGESYFPLYKVEDFFIENVKNVVEQSIYEYFQKIIHLITSNKLTKHDKIIIINNNLKWLKEHGLISSINLLNIKFNTMLSNKYLNYELNNTQLINNAALIYYNTNMYKDYALLTFKKYINPIIEQYMTIKE